MTREPQDLSSLYRELKLMDPDEFAIEAMRRNLNKEREAVMGPKMLLREHHRRTGRTTRMLIRVLAELQRGGTVRIVAGNLAMTRHLRGTLRDMLEQLEQSELLSNAQFTSRQARDDDARELATRGIITFVDPM